MHRCAHGRFDRDITSFLVNSPMDGIFGTLLVGLLATPVAKWTAAPLPAAALLPTCLLLVKQLGMRDDIRTMVILDTSMNLPLAVWMMRSLLLEVPREVLVAGGADGAGLITSIRKSIRGLSTGAVK